LGGPYKGLFPENFSRHTETSFTCIICPAAREWAIVILSKIFFTDSCPLRLMLAAKAFYRVSPSAELVVSVNNEIGVPQNFFLRRPYLTLGHDLTIMRAAISGR